MSGISMLTALEIFTNPKDLEITIGHEKGGDKFAIGIFRGPSHNFKPMLTSQPFAKTPEDAVEAIKGILETVRQAATKELGNKESILFQHLNLDNREIDQSRILDSDFVDRILDELRRCRVASTYKMFASQAKGQT